MSSTLNNFCYMNSILPLQDCGFFMLRFKDREDLEQESTIQLTMH